MTLSWKSHNRSSCTLCGIWKPILFVAALIGIASPVTAQKNSDLCALLPDADVSAVLGVHLKLSAKPLETSKLGGGTERSRDCVYDTPRGGLGSPTVRVTITEVSSPTLAAQWFKEQAELHDRFMAGDDGKGQPLNGVGDQALAYPKSGSIYMRKQSVIVHITIFHHLDYQKKLEQSKQLAQKAAARIK